MPETGEVIPVKDKNESTASKGYQARKRLVVFLICVIMSGLMWLFIELMKDYNDEMKYGVTFKNVPRDLALINSGDSFITIGLNAQGFDLLATRYLQRNRNVTLDLSNVRLRATPTGYMAFMTSNYIKEQLFKQLRYSKSIVYVKPDTLFFRFSELYSKQVPVYPRINYSNGNANQFYDTVVFSPRFVTVKSIKSIIDTITMVSTQSVTLSQSDSNTTRTVPIYKSVAKNLIKFSPDSITLNLKVEPVTEAVFTVPVKMETNGETLKIFPDKVEVQCKVPLSAYSKIDASAFEAQVKYSKSSIKGGSKLKVDITRSPASARMVRVKPAEVEFIVISK